MFLAAPALFFWGVGTSSIGEYSLNWDDTASATALAVATIIIPAIDAFCNSQRFEQWNDKVKRRMSCRPGGGTDGKDRQEHSFLVMMIVIGRSWALARQPLP